MISHNHCQLNLQQSLIDAQEPLCTNTFQLYSGKSNTP